MNQGSLATRPSFPQFFQEVALAAAKRATCPRLHVGAVLVNPYSQIIATGYNGSPSGLPHCTEVGCLIPDGKPCQKCMRPCPRCGGAGSYLTDYHKREFEDCPECGGKGYTYGTVVDNPGTVEAVTRQCPECFGTGLIGSCKRTTHAEANALIQCSRSGARPMGATLYVTHRPCVGCAGLLITAGIIHVSYLGTYESDKAGSDVVEMFELAGVGISRWNQ